MARLKDSQAEWPVDFVKVANFHEGKQMYFGSEPDEIENERKRLLIIFFTGLGSGFLLVFGTISFVNGRLLLGAALLFFLLLVVLIHVVARKIKQVHLLSITLSTVLLLMAAYLLLGGGAEGTGVYWSYAISMLMVLLLGPVIGAIYMGTYLIVIATGLFGDFPGINTYSDMESSRILVTSFTLYVLILSSEWIRHKSYGAISHTSESHRQLANTDPLTKALNRAGLYHAISEHPDPIHAVVVLLDIDKFKETNDTYGHDAGDHILVCLVDCLKQNTKGRDLVVRYGGEEFLLVFFNTSIGAVKNLTDRIRREFGGKVFAFNENRTQCTFSAGMSPINSASDLESAIKLADEKLYAAKASGRNQVVH